MAFGRHQDKEQLAKYLIDTINAYKQIFSEDMDIEGSFKRKIQEAYETKKGAWLNDRVRDLSVPELKSLLEIVHGKKET